MSARSRYGVIAAALVTLLLWSYSWIVMKQALQYAGPFDFVSLRYLIGAAVLFGALAASGRSLRPPPLLPVALIGLLQTAMFQGLAQWALVSGGAGKVALLAYTMPFWSVLLAWPLLAEQPSRRQWLGLGLAALGLVLIIEPWRGLGSGWGTLLAVLGGLGWAGGTVLSKRLFQRHDVQPLSLTAWQMLFGALALGVTALLVPQRPLDWSLPFIATLAYSAVLASSVAWALWLLVVQRLPTAVATVSSLGVPILSVLLAWMILDEQPTPWEGGGIVLILLGLVAVTGIGMRRR